MFPDWFEHKIGFTWLDESGDIHIYLGLSSFREIVQVSLCIGESKIADVPELRFRPKGHVYTFRYKGEWHFADLTESMADEADFFKDCKPFSVQ